MIIAEMAVLELKARKKESKLVKKVFAIAFWSIYHETNCQFINRNHATS